MRGVSPVIESVLLAAAVILFMLGIVGALNSFLTTVTEQKLKNTLRIDGEKLGYAILLAKKMGEEASGEVKIYVELADVPEEIEVKEGGVYVRSGDEVVRVPIYGVEAYVNSTHNRITNAQGYHPYVLYSNGEIRLGVE